MFTSKRMRWTLIIIGSLLLIALAYQLPPIHQRLSWRIDFAWTYVRGIIRPIRAVPTPLPVTVAPDTATATPLPTQPGVTSKTAQSTQNPSPTPSPQPTATAIPAAVELPAPDWEKQDINNCGPATLAMNLRYYGWEGDQFPIADLLKPHREDRNVNVEELVYYVRTRAGWLNAEYRVGGSLELLKKLLAAGFPVIIEESFYFEQPYWPNDDLWAAHYNLLTGYDDKAGVFTGQDSFHGPDQQTDYDTLDAYWHVFNRVYIVIYPPQQEELLKNILGENWDVEQNRQNALDASRAETVRNPQDAFAWFNLGSNLVFFERWGEAAEAFDHAREIGVPQRMLRYQFTPFFAYFHSRRIDDLLALTEYAQHITPNAEEAYLWHGWGLYRQGDTNGAIDDFQRALEENPNYQDAEYALDFVRQNP